MERAEGDEVIQLAIDKLGNKAVGNLSKSTKKREADNGKELIKIMISFHTEEIKFTLKNKTILKKWIISVIKKKRRKAGDLNFIFCSDDHLLGINKQYLHHDTYTDIITFDYSKEDLKMPVSGDIFISIDRVAENSKKFGKTFENELHRVIIHGTLHLLGYNDKTKAAKEEMTKEEDKALKKLFSDSASRLRSK